MKLRIYISDTTINLEYTKMEEVYILEEDYPLMASINHYTHLANKEDYKYKFIEIMKRIEQDDVVFLADLKLLEKELKCPVRTQMLKAPKVYLGIGVVGINSISDINHFLGKGKGYKLDFNGLRKAINATW